MRLGFSLYSELNFRSQSFRTLGQWAYGYTGKGKKAFVLAKFCLKVRQVSHFEPGEPFKNKYLRTLLNARIDDQLNPTARIRRGRKRPLH
jgi:hypothetical protein